MGGKGSGRHRLSEEERRRRAGGKLRKERTDEGYNEKAAKKILTGPWVSDLPRPSIPLAEEGLKEYERLARLLLNNNKLTTVTAKICEQAAMLHQKQINMMSAGKDPPVSLVNRMISILSSLRIAEDAAPIANPNRRNKFEGSGFSNSRNSPFRLRSLPASNPGEL